jgi:hypothetical protein
MRATHSLTSGSPEPSGLASKRGTGAKPKAHGRDCMVKRPAVPLGERRGISLNFAKELHIVVYSCILYLHTNTMEKPNASTDDDSCPSRARRQGGKALKN